MDFAAFLDPRVQEAIRIRHEMLQQEWTNRVQSLIEGLGAEDLVTLRTMFSNAGQSPALAPYYEGILAATLHYRFPDNCANCGELHEAMPTVDATTEDEGDLEADLAQAVDLDALLNEDGSLNEEMLPPATGPASNLLAQLEEYNVLLVKIEEPLGPVVCRGCGTTYVSLEDRMLREPGKEGCGACIQKEKWG